MKLYKIKVLYSKVKMKKFHTDTVYVMVDENISKADVNEAIINAVSAALPPDMVLLQIDRERIKDTIEIKMNRVIPKTEKHDRVRLGEDGDDKEPDYIGYGGNKEDKPKLVSPLYWSELSLVDKEAIIKYNKELVYYGDEVFEVDGKRFVEGAYVRSGNYIRKITNVLYEDGKLNKEQFWDDSQESGHGRAKCDYSNYTMI